MKIKKYESPEVSLLEMDLATRVMTVSTPGADTETMTENDDWTGKDAWN